MDDTPNTDTTEVLKSRPIEVKEGLSSVIGAEPAARRALFEQLAGVPVAHEDGEAHIFHPGIEGLDDSAPGDRRSKSRRRALQRHVCGPRS